MHNLLIFQYFMVWNVNKLSLRNIPLIQTFYNYERDQLIYECEQPRSDDSLQKTLKGPRRKLLVLFLYKNPLDEEHPLYKKPPLRISSLNRAYLQVYPNPLYSGYLFLQDVYCTVL